MRAIADARRLQLGSEDRMVVNLAIVDELQIAVVASHRLLALSNVYDAQSAVTESNSVLDEQARGVWAAGHKNIPHLRDRLDRDRLVGSRRASDTADSAHRAMLPRPGHRHRHRHSKARPVRRPGLARLRLQPAPPRRLERSPRRGHCRPWSSSSIARQPRTARPERGRSEETAVTRTLQ